MNQRFVGDNEFFQPDKVSGKVLDEAEVLNLQNRPRPDCDLSSFVALPNHGSRFLRTGLGKSFSSRINIPEW